MRGMIFKGDREVEVLNFDDPIPGPGEVVIEMKASGMCGSDLHPYRLGQQEVIKSMGFKDMASRGLDESAPVIGGHEPCGVVAETGPGVNPKAFRKGDRVMVFHYEGCSCCNECRTGWTQLCEEGAAPHGLILHGGHAEYMKVPASCLVHLPDGMSFAGGAAVTCGTSTAWGALLRLDISARDQLVVYGLGPVGLSAVQLASAMGVEVIGVDISTSRMQQAIEFGATHVINGMEQDPVEQVHKLSAGKGVSCAMDCAGTEITRLQAIRSTSTWGKIALVGIGNQLSADAMKDVIRRQRTIIGSYTFSEVAMKNCAQFIVDHDVKVDDLFTDYWRLDQADEAYKSFDKQSGGKGVFIF